MTAPILQAVTAKGSGTATATTNTVDTTGVTDLRVIVITQSAVSPTVSDNKNSGNWSVDGTAVQLNATFTAYVHSFKATTGSTVGTGHTFTAVGGTASSIWVLGFKPGVGGDTLTITQFVAQADASSPYTSPSKTTSTADALLVTFGSDDGSGSPVTLTWDSSFSSVSGGAVTDQNSFWGGALGSRTVTSTGTYSSGFTTSSSGAANAVIGIYAVTESGSTPSLPKNGLAMMGCGV